MSALRGLVWPLCAAGALVAAVPAALTAARSPEFTTSFQAYPVEHRLFELPGGPAGYVRLLLRDPALGRRTVALSGLAIDDTAVRDRVGVRAADRGVVLDVRERTPERAQELAAALRVALERTGRAAFRAEAAARRRFVRSRLKSPRTTPSERRRLAARARALPRFFGTRRTRILLGPPPREPRAARTLDRAADALPGRYPPAVEPAGAATAGVLAAALLVFAAALSRASLRDRPAPAAARRRSLPRTARRRSPP